MKPGLSFADAVHRLAAGFRSGLPGPAAQARLAPRPRRQWPEGFNPARIRHAAGLLLVYPDATDGAASLVLTLRSDRVERHRGQVSLPGGVVEPGETFEQAALREAHEEIALSRDAPLDVLGALTPLDIPISGFRLHPVVAAAAQRQNLVPSDGEVARILEVRIDDLLDPARLVTDSRDRDGLPASLVPMFRIHDVDIWGATAMVLAEFLTLLGWAQAESERS